MKKYYLFAGLVLLAASPAFAQTKIGAAGAPDPSAMLEVTSGTANNKGLLMPRMTTIQRNAITNPATGLMIYNTTTNQVQVNTGTPALPTWAVATATATGWATDGNTGTTPANNFIGTTDNQPLVVRTSNTEKVRVTATGNVGIGVVSPATKLHVSDTGDVAIRVASTDSGKAAIQLGNPNHGLIRNLTASGGGPNDVAVYTSLGSSGGADLHLISNPVASGSNGLPIDQFVLKNTGDIGIGTNTPAQKLHVEGTARIATAVGTPTTITGRNAAGDVGNVTVGTGLSFAAGVLTATPVADNTDWNLTGNTGTNPATNFIGTGDAQPLAIRTNNTEKVRVTAAGYVGIGTNAPIAKLNVVDTGNAFIVVGSSTDGMSSVSLINGHHGMSRNLTSSGGTTTDVALYTTSAPSAPASLYLAAKPTISDSIPLNQFVLKNTGNVGIGTNSPLVKLQVVDTGNASITVASSTNDIASVNLGNGRHGITKNLASSGGLGNDVALFTNSGPGPASAGSIYLSARPSINDSLLLNQFVLKNTGNVGIGTNSPQTKLHVSDTGDVAIRVASTDSGKAAIQLGNPNHGLIRNLTASGGGPNDVAVYTSLGSSGGADIHLISNPVATGSNGLPIDQFVLKNNGNVGIGTGAPTAKLSVNGTTNNLSGTWGIFSDARVKTVDGEYKDGLVTVMKIHPVKFHYNANAPFKSKEQQIGIIAQEIEQIAPYMVSKVNADGFNDLRQYNNQALPYMLVNAIQEQQAQIETLKAKNEQLEAANKVTAQLMERVKQMEQMMGINEIEGTSKIAGK